MAKHTTLAALFTAIADAIREKAETADLIVADDFPEMILALPVVKTVNITAENISKYFTVTNGSYYFAGSGNTFTSNNGGVNSSTATTTLTALRNMEVKFTYSYSSEKSYDKFTLTAAGSTVVSGVSGSTTTQTWSGKLTAGQTIKFEYAKDGSSSSYDDRCTFSDMVITVY